MSAIGIVGARNASASSLKITSRIAADLSAAGVTVVSGLARGIDTAAHRASLESGTIACVAGGIDIFYPPENEALQREIAATGLIVSEMPYGTRPQARHFPRRNRLISGLSDGVVVIEAALRSGSLITARFALEQGRDVYAVPGSPLDPRAQGANRLIRDGAALVQSASDILEDFRAVIPAPKATEQAKVSIETASLQSEADVSDLLTLLSDTPTALDDLVRLSGAPAEDVMAACLELELGGKIARHSGGRVSRIF